jgi:hypothetical protein
MTWHDRLTDALLAKLDETRYPSAPMLHRIERSIADRERAEEYVERLIERIEADRFPSPSMIDRVERLVSALDRATDTATTG